MNKMNPKTSIIIVNWNGKHYLDTCLSSVFSQTYSNFEIIIVDNASSDGSMEFVRKNYPDVRIIELKKNHGFAGGNNIGIKQVLKDKNVRYIALLNNDTKVDKNWLYELVRIAEGEENIGIAASIIFPMNNTNIDSTNPVNKLKNLHNWLMHIYYRLQYPPSVAHATACLYRREMLEDIGLFDESFFAYCEDLELSWRAYKKGWKAKYVPSSIVYHEAGGTSKNSKKLKREMAFLFARNWAITVKRHATPVQKIVFVLVFTKTAIMSWIGMMVGSNNIGIKPYLRAFKEFLS